jgi:hypothetical protein
LYVAKFSWLWKIDFLYCISFNSFETVFCDKQQQNFEGFSWCIIHQFIIYLFVLDQKFLYQTKMHWYCVYWKHFFFLNKSLPQRKTKNENHNFSSHIHLDCFFSFQVAAQNNFLYNLPIFIFFLSQWILLFV